MKVKRNMQILLPLTLLATSVIHLAADDTSLTDLSSKKNRFPDFRDDPRTANPPWTGPVFQLSQDYPKAPPPAQNYPWKQYDPKTQWREYLTSVLSYCYEGNIECDWVVQQNAKRKWYHAPWLHWGRNGREFVHGLTHERVSQPGELAPTQVSRFQNWAISIYNASGGYIIGQIWKDPENPSAAAFPEGTVSVKLLFTQASVAEVPYLKGAKEWQADIYQSVAIPTNPILPRSIQTVRLLQIDVAVRDSRADDTTGWVFGTFIYNGDRPGTTPWEKMVPIGLTWGNDETLTIARQRSGQVPRETIINPGPEVPFQHLGYAGRLAGPVDNPMSSCLSCHSTAQWPNVAIVPPRNALVDSEAWLKWFRTIPTDVPFSENAIPLGYSLQLAVGLENYKEWRDQTETGGGFRSHTDEKEKPKKYLLSREALQD
jgi:hypothetical protein